MSEMAMYFTILMIISKLRSWLGLNTEHRDEEDAQSLIMPNLALPSEEDERQPLPDFNDKNFPQDNPAGTFRGVKVPLRKLVFDSDINWEMLFDAHFA
jgi:hypothetical protein